LSTTSPKSHGLIYLPRAWLADLTRAKRRLDHILIGLMESMIKWFGKRESFYVIMDLKTREPICYEGDL